MSEWRRLLVAMTVIVGAVVAVYLRAQGIRSRERTDIQSASSAALRDSNNPAPGGVRPREADRRLTDVELVVEMGKQPVSGARVCSVRGEGRSWCGETTMAGTLPDGIAQQLRSGLEVSLGGQGLCFRQVTLVAGLNRVEMQACKTLAVRGRTIDVWGGAIENALVSASQEQVQLAWSGVAEDGAFSLHLPAYVDSAVELRVIADGYARGVTAVVPPANNVHLVLMPLSSISGIVVDGKGEPVAHATVESRAAILAGRHEASRTVADDVGRFQLSGLESGRHHLSAYTPRHQAEIVTVPLNIGEHVESVVLEAIAGHAVVVDLRDAHGEPCRVGKVWMPEPRRHGQRTEAGEWLLAGVAPGGRQVFGECEGDRVASVAVEVRGDSTVVIESEPGVTIRGTVLDDRNEPVVGASVQVDQSHGSIKTDAEGVFVLRGLPPDQPLSLSAWAAGYLPSERLELSDAGDESSVTLTTPRGTCFGVSLVGREPVVFSVGAPQRPISARLLRLTPAQDREVCGFEEAELVELRAFADGGRLPVRFVLGDGDESDVHNWTVSANANLVVALTDAESEPISGQVLMGDQPVVDALVLLTKHLQGEACVRPSIREALRASVTDSDGHFELTALPTNAAKLGLFVEDRESGQVWCEIVTSGGHYVLTDREPTP